MTEMQTTAHADAHCTMFETDIGQCGLAWSRVGLTRVQLPEENAAATEVRLLRHGAMLWESDLPPRVAECVAMLRRYATGQREAFADVTLDLSPLTAFDARIYAALRSVPWGTTTTYGALAAQIQTPGSARAVGTAMRTNPWPVIVPCHRVLPASHQIGGFSAHGGAETKYALLELEGVHLRQPSLWDE
jgi:methylated-DNA-[protein]-cysteine S-methyltransferase